jgi:hypothetical protein
LMIGDWNAQIGDFDEERWGNVRGKFMDGESWGKINGNGRRLLNFCKREGLCVSITYYKKDSYVTHTFANKSEHTIDFCWIPVECKKLLKDAGVEEIAEVWSDHNFVTLTSQYEDKPHRKVYEKAIRRIDYSSYIHDWLMRKRVGARVDQGITEKRAMGGR